MVWLLSTAIGVALWFLLVTISARYAKEKCEHEFTPSDITNFNIDPECNICGEKLSKINKL